jgi:hypothetical protein
MPSRALRGRALRLLSSFFPAGWDASRLLHDPTSFASSRTAQARRCGQRGWSRQQRDGLTPTTIHLASRGTIQSIVQVCPLRLLAPSHRTTRASRSGDSALHRDGRHEAAERPAFDRQGVGTRWWDAELVTYNSRGFAFAVSPMPSSIMRSLQCSPLARICHATEIFSQRYVQFHSLTTLTPPQHRNSKKVR